VTSLIKGWTYAKLLPMTFQKISSSSKELAKTIPTQTPVTASPLAELNETDVIRPVSIVNNLVSIAGLHSIPAMRTTSDTTHNTHTINPRDPVSHADQSQTHLKAFADLRFDSPLTHRIPSTPVFSEPEKVTVWVSLIVNDSLQTSTLKRTLQTASCLPFTKMQWRQLDELDSGACDSMTFVS
jgi:hypothetical protein